ECLEGIRQVREREWHGVSPKDLTSTSCASAVEKPDHPWQGGRYVLPWRPLRTDSAVPGAKTQAIRTFPQNQCTGNPVFFGARRGSAGVQITPQFASLEGC